MHDHAHAGDDHGHDHGALTPRRPLTIALAISAAFLVVEVVGAWLTGSLALLADAGHMLTDVAALALALFAFWVSARPATPEQTFGYYRVEVLAAAVNAGTLVLIALYIFYEAYERLWDPPAVQSGLMLVVAVAGLLANVASAWVLGHGHGGNLNARGAFLHVLGDMLGSVGALVAAAVMLTTGWLYADPLASVLIGLFTLWSGWRLLRESVDVLLEATPRGVDVRAVERELSVLPAVVGMHDLHVWTVTSGFLALSAHLTVEGADPDELLVRASDLLRARFGIDHVTLQIEKPVLEERVHHGCYVGTGCTLATGTEPAAAAPADDDRLARASAEARETVHGRLALISCAVWTVGVFLSIWVAPSDGWVGAAATAFLVPAAAVWLARPRLIVAETERRLKVQDGSPGG